MELEYYTYTNLLKMGFSKNLILEYLPKPLLKDNPHYKAGPKMKLYLKGDVENFMKSDVFINTQEKRKNRVNGALRAASKRRKETYSYIDYEINKIEVERIDLDELEELTLEAKALWLSWTKDDIYGFDNLSDDTLTRWMINYVRHNLTNYDEVLENIKGKFGVKESYLKFRETLMLKIKDTYPELFSNKTEN